MSTMQPPTTPDEEFAAEQPRAKWPTVWGVLFLIWAGLTVLASCCGGFAVWMAPTFAQMGGMSEFPKAPPILSWWMIADGVISIFLFVILLMGGMALLRRRPAAAKLVMVYVVARLLFVAPALLFGVAIEKPMVEWQREMAQAQVDFFESRQATPPQSLIDQAKNTEVTLMARVQLFGGAAVTAIFPLVAGIFFSRKTIKDQIKGWST